MASFYPEQASACQVPYSRIIGLLPVMQLCYSSVGAWRRGSVVRLCWGLHLLPLHLLCMRHHVR